MSRFHQKSIQTLLFTLFAFPLFKVNIANLLVILLILICLSYNPRQILKFFTWENLKFTIPFWIILITSVFYFGQNNWYDSIQNALPFLIYPLSFFLIPNQYFENNLITKYLIITKVSCIIILTTFIVTFIYYYSLQDFFKIDYQISKFRDFAYNETPFFKIHPTYYTLLLVFLVGNSLENLSKKINLFDLTFILLSYGITFLLLSKLTVVLLIILTTFYIFKKNHFSLRNKIIVGFVFLSITFSLGLKVPGMYERFREVFLSFNTPPKGVAHDSTNVRLSLYKCDINILKDNFFYGVGFHNIKNEINTCLESNYDATFFKDYKFLTHNYFIYMFAGAGILGFTSFLLYVFYLYRKAFEIKSTELFILLSCISVGCFTEDFLYRNFGTLFLHIYFFMYLKNNLLFNDNKNTINH